MKKIKYLALVIIFSGLLQSCLKDTAFLDVSNTTPVVELPFGTSAASIAPISFGTLPDTTEFDTVIAINLASPQVLNTDVIVTVTLDNSLITSYNKANPSNTLSLMPDSVCPLQKTIVDTIKAGYRIKKIPLKFNVTKLNPAVSYAIPYTITSAKAVNGQTILVSGNLGSIMYGFIGNLLAGGYTWDFTRYNNNTGTGTPTGASFTGHSVNFLPDDPTHIEVTSGYYTGTARYVVSFDKTGGVPHNFSVHLNPSDVGSIFSANGITVVQDAQIIDSVYNPPTQVKFTFFYIVKNSSGFRYLIDSYHNP